MKLKNTIITSISLAAFAFAATSADAATLMVDFGAGPVASGFSGQSTASVTHSTSDGDITVAIANQQGLFDRASPSGANQIDNVYRDFIFDNNSDGFNITLSGAGIAANTGYTMTFYAYDSGEVRPTAVAGISGTAGTKLTGFAATTTAAPTSLDQHTATGVFTSDGAGVLSFLVDGTGNSGIGRSSINALELTAVSSIPEPSSTALLGLGGLALILRRRK